MGIVGVEGFDLLREKQRNLSKGEIAFKKWIHVEPSPVLYEVLYAYNSLMYCFVYSHVTRRQDQEHRCDSTNIRPNFTKSFLW